jgi:hypothetical protein
MRHIGGAAADVSVFSLYCLFISPSVIVSGIAEYSGCTRPPNPYYCALPIPPGTQDKGPGFMSSGLGSTSCFTPARFLSLVVAASLVLLTFFTFYRHTPHHTDSLHIKPQAVWDDASSWVSNMWQPERPDRKPKPKLELQHTYLPNGLLQTNMEGRHPMMELIEEAERKWESKLNR